MSARRVLAGSVTALLLPASLLMIGTGSSVAAPTSGSDTAVQASVFERKAATKVTLTGHPQIAQQGKKATSANSAHAAFSGQVKGAPAGRPVVLEYKVGSKWKKAAKTKTAKQGKVEVTAKYRATSYRLSTPAFKGKKAGTSKPVDMSRWATPSFSDEFAGSALSETWTHRGQFHQPESARSCSKGDPRAVAVSGGALRLSVLKDPERSDTCNAEANGKSTGKFAYRLNGHVGTQTGYSFKYGYAAARIKTQKSRGQHSAFWLQPADDTNVKSGAKTGGAEIDVMEYFGDKHPFGGVTSFTYAYKGNKQVKTGSWIKNVESTLKNKKDGFSKNYHVFSVEWTPKEYVFRIDGKETYRSKANVSGVAQYPILSMLSSDYALHLGGDKALPQHAYVDWIRVWEL